jgi:hypothetical protein
LYIGNRSPVNDFSVRTLFLNLVLWVLISASGLFAGQLNGTVKSELNQPVAGAVVELFDAATQVFFKSSTCDANGNYLIDSIFGGMFSVKIKSDSFPIQWYSPNGNTLYPQTTISISTASINTIAIILNKYPIDNLPASQLNVLIKDSTGNPFVCVGGFVQLFDSSGFQVQLANTDAMGIATFNSLQPGHYSIKIYSPPYPIQYYNPSMNSNFAVYYAPIIKNDTQSIAVNLTMTPGGQGRIYGKVFLETGAPAPMVRVDLYNGIDMTNSKIMIYTDPLGGFSFTGIPEQTFYLRLSAPPHPDQWYSKSLNMTTIRPLDDVLASATLVDTVNVHLLFKPAGCAKVSVILKDETGIPATGKASIVDLNNYEKIMIYDSSAKIYKIDSVPPAKYSLKFECPGYNVQYYGLSGNTLTPAYYFGVDTLDLQFNATLKKFTAPYGIISGFIKDNLQPVAGALVRVYTNNGAFVSETRTDSTGKYSQLKGYIDTACYLSVEASGYPLQYYTQSGPVLDPNVAYRFTCITNDTTRIILSISKFTPVTYGLISGFIKDSLQPVAGAIVRVYTDKGIFISETRTDSTGKYSQLKGYIDTACYLSVEAIGYPVQYYAQSGPVLDPNAAYRFTCVTNDTTKINFVISKFTTVQKKQVSITVNLKDDFGMSAIGKVSLLNMSGTERPLKYDSLVKAYRADSVISGNYTLKFDVPGYDLQYYGQSGNTLTAAYYFSVDTINLQFNATLKKFTIPVTYGIISGFVKDSTQPVTGAAVRIYSNEGILVSQSRTDSTGRFPPLKGYIDTTCYISIEATGYPIQYYTQNGPVLDQMVAYRFTCTANDTARFTIQISRFNLVFNKFNSIKGIVRSDAGRPVVNAKVLLADTSAFATSPTYSPTWINSRYSTYTDSYGAFSFNNIAPGKYYAIAQAESLNYVLQFFNQKDDPSSADRIQIDSTSALDLSFTLRTGCIVTGSAKDSKGAPLQDVNFGLQQVSGSKTYQVKTDSNGTFQLNGISSGKYSIWVSKYEYINRNPGSIDLQTIENQSVSIPLITMDNGGRISGTATIKNGFIYSTGNYIGGNLSIFKDSLFSRNEKYLWPTSNSGIQILVPAGSSSGTFKSDPIPVGKYRMLFSPCDNCNAAFTGTSDTTIPDTLKFRVGLGWSYIGKDTSIQYLPFYNIISGDTIANSSLTLRKGYSVFGRVKTTDGTQINSDYSVSAFVKQDSGILVCVSRSRILNDGRFELPGLIDNENYYMHVYAPGFMGQFWSPFDGNTSLASTPYHFSTSSFTPLVIPVSSSPAGNIGPGIMGPITLWKDPDSSSVVLRWKKDDSTAIDTFKVYATDRNGIKLLKSIPSGPASFYSYTDTRTLSEWQRYRVAGFSANRIVRSGPIYYEPREKSTPPGHLWINAYGNRSGVNIEWGIPSDISLTPADSVDLYKKKSGGLWTRILRQSAYNRILGDYKWNSNDSGSTCYYKVEINSQNLISSEQMFEFDSKFFNGLSPVITVGPFEKFKTIQSAIDAAADYTTIRVRAGTYYENLNFKGKAISIEGDWEFGKPPVLDGNGGVSITVPYFPQTEDYNPVRINGFKIRNALTGIRTSSSISIEQNLFVNIVKAVDVQIDSVMMMQAMSINPVLSNRIDVNVWQCTFISKMLGNTVASVSSRGIAESPSYSGSFNGNGDFYIKPVVSYYSNLGVNNSIIAYYYSNGKQTNIPFTTSGASSRVSIYNSDLWQTQSSASPPAIMTGSDLLNTDPMFIDTINYFVSATSALATAKDGIGYDSRYTQGYENQKPQPSAIKNLFVRVVGIKSVFLKWDPAPLSEKIVSYRIFRGPGDSSLFYINPNSQWEPKVSKDSMFSVIDTFSTVKQWFLDTSIEAGKPYLYVVSAVDSSGTEGKIDMSAQRPITSYFVNKLEYTFKVRADKWYMMSPWGTENLSIASPDNYVYYWDVSKSADKLLGQYNRTSQLKPCQGYWFKPAKDTILTVGTGSLLKLHSVQDSLSINLVSGTSGWNQIASPLPFIVSPSWMNSFTVWEWNADSLGYTKTDSLKPWQAYWIYTSKDTVLPLIEKSLPISGATLTKSLSVKTFWDLSLSLTGKNVWDTENHLGAVPKSLSKSAVIQLEPPFAFGSSQLYFVNNESENSTSEKDKMLSGFYKFSDNVIPHDKMEFPVAITPSQTQSVLRVGNLGSLPKEVYAYWIDSRGAVDLRERSEITIDKHNETVFGIVIVTSNPADIRIYSYKFSVHTPYPNPSRGASVIEYVLPYNWSSGVPNGETKVKIKIFDISGRVIKTLADRTEAAGVHHVIWDGKNSRSQRIPAGIYIIRLESGSNYKSMRISRF